jgi:hypothetical protein
MISFNYKWIITCCAIIVTALSLPSCSKDDESYDVVGDPSNIVYINTQGSSSIKAPKNLFSFSIVHTPAGDIGDVLAKIPVRSTKPMNKSVTVKAELDTSLVSAYNKTYGTKCLVLPDGVLDMSKATAIIKEGKYTSADSITVSINPTKRSLLSGSAYLAPIKLVSVSESDIKINKDYSTAYILINTSSTNCYQKPSASDMVGTLVSNRSLWTASFDVSTYGSISNLFDGDTGSDVYYGSKNSTLTLDLANTYNNITGIRIHTWDTQYGLTNMNVSSSNDGTNWTLQGSAALTTGNIYQYIKFYSPISSRYIKLEITGWLSNYIDIAEIDVYTN